MNSLKPVTRFEVLDQSRNGYALQYNNDKTLDMTVREGMNVVERSGVKPYAAADLYHLFDFVLSATRAIKDDRDNATIRQNFVDGDYVDDDLGVHVQFDLVGDDNNTVWTRLTWRSEHGESSVATTVSTDELWAAARDLDRDYPFAH